jgi:dTDP-4-dehydrorhamnose 3,5-epimerase
MPNSNIFKESSLKGVWIHSSKVHKDPRGTTNEWFNLTIVPNNFTEIKISQLLTTQSKKNVIRGIHFSGEENPQYKIIKCLHGTILDVVIDLRRNSSSFGKYEIFLLDAKEQKTLMIPNGFGHGYQVISKHAVVQYALQTNFRFEDEHVINPFDIDLNIPWHAGEYILSPKDRNGKNFNQYFWK